MGGGSLQYSPHRPHPPHTLGSGLTSPLEMMPPGPIGCPQSPVVPWGKSSCVHLLCTLAKGSLAHSWAGEVSLAALIFLADKPPGPPLPQHPPVFSMTISTAPLEECFVLGRGVPLFHLERCGVLPCALQHVWLEVKRCLD